MQRRYDVVVADDYSNSSPAVLAVIRSVSGKDIISYKIDIRDQHALDDVFAAHKIDAAIHFAAKKYIRESLPIPLDYYAINVGCSISLVTAMLKHGCAV